jgi:NADH dehydrogenase FAD-containing subunit
VHDTTRHLRAAVDLVLGEVNHIDAAGAVVVLADGRRLPHD